MQRAPRCHSLRGYAVLGPQDASRWYTFSHAGVETGQLLLADLQSLYSDRAMCALQVMGSAHNMFGTLNVVTVRSSRCSEQTLLGEPSFQSATLFAQSIVVPHHSLTEECPSGSFFFWLYCLCAGAAQDSLAYELQKFIW